MPEFANASFHSAIPVGFGCPGTATSIIAPKKNLVNRVERGESELAGNSGRLGGLFQP